MAGTATSPAATTVAFVGDAPRAAGYRLAGVRTWSPAPGGEVAAFDAALAQAGVVLLSATIAQRLPASLLEGACTRAFPLVMIEPDPGMSALAIDPVSRVRRQLSLELDDEP